MTRREADRFEESLQQAAEGKKVEGELAPLVQTAQLVSALADAPPPPPRGLQVGRRQFLTQAADLRARKAVRQEDSLGRTHRLRLAGALIAAVLVMGLVFGAGQAAANSLPGGPLYDLKLFAEETRMNWTTDAAARAELAVHLMEKRLDEIVALLEQGQAIDEATAIRAKEQLSRAVQAISEAGDQTAPQAAQQLMTLLQEQQQVLVQAARSLSGLEQEPLQELLREMERLRQELHTGQGEPSGPQNRQRQGAPPTATPLPEPTERPSPGPQPSDRPMGPKPTEGPSSGPEPQPTDKPAGPKPTERPSSGPEPQPTDKPAGPKPTQDPGSGPDPQPTDKPRGPEPTQDPGSGHDPQPSEAPTSGPGPQGPGGGSGGSGKP